MNTDDRKKLELTVDKNPELGRRLRINVHGRLGFTELEIKQHKSAMELLEIVVNSLEFKQRLIMQTFTSETMDTEKIYNVLMTGKEKPTPGKDYELDLKVEMYIDNSDTIGYTYGDTVQTWLNRKWFGVFTLGEIASNALHEWLHVAGFDHTTDDEYTSVPYAVGYLAEEMVSNYEKGSRYVDLYPEVVIVSPGVKIPVKPKNKKKVCKRVWSRLGLLKVCWYE